MALQTSGAISLNDIHIEAGGTSGTTVSMNDTDVRGLIGKGAGASMSFNEWYGAARLIATVQRGVTSSTGNITISSVDTSKSFVIAKYTNGTHSTTGGFTDGSRGYGYGYGWSRSFSAELTSSTNIAISAGSGSGGDIAWEVVEYE